MIDALRPYLQHHKNCKRGRVIEPAACPSCGESMRPVRNTSGYLNDDQFDAVKAGDFFCKRHEEIVYAWESDLPKHGCTCDLDKVLAALPVIDPPVTSALTRYRHRKGEASSFLWADTGGGLWTHHESPEYGGDGWVRGNDVARLEQKVFSLSGTPAPAEPTQEP